jgi:aldehyde:ferredoxin oxidoreductase
MGAKGLKAVAVKASGEIAVKKPEDFLERIEALSRRLRAQKSTNSRRKYGTLRGSALHNNVSGLPYKNFQDDHIPEEHLERISHEVFHTRYETGLYACTACPTPCGHVYRIEDGLYAGTVSTKAEANSVWNFGGKLAVDDAGAILKAQETCCQLGLDIDNASSVIAWAIDCYKHDILSKQETDGLKLEWGKSEVILELLRKMAHRDGLGNLLAEGSLRASKQIGRGSERFAFHIKGQDLTEALRAMKGWALGVVVSPRGGTHTRGAPVTELGGYLTKDNRDYLGFPVGDRTESYEGKPRLVSYFEYVHALLDSLGVCFFTGNWTSPDGMSIGELAELYSLAAGVEVSEEEMWKTGERIHNVEKMLSTYHGGFGREDDYPPRRFMTERIESGPLKGEYLNPKDWDRALDEYYDIHGWDKRTGWPTRKKLVELDLPDCVMRLEELLEEHTSKSENKSRK